MSQFSFESEAMELPAVEQQQQNLLLEAEAELNDAADVEFFPEQAPAESPIAVALTVDEFAALEERILRAVNLVKRERMRREVAEQQVAQLEEQLRQQTPKMEEMQRELGALRAERGQVRERVERLLGELDALEL